MDRNELRIGRLTRHVTLISGVFLILVSWEISASEKPADTKFLEWLGQRVEIEEFGVNLDDWDDTAEQESEEDDTAVDTQ